MLANEASGSQVKDERLVDAWVEGPVEALKVLNARDMGLLEAPGKEPVSASGQLVLDKQFQKVRKGKLMVDGLLVPGVQGGSHTGESE